jgi:hypothetical protein
MEGKGGGLALFCNDTVGIDLITFGSHHIDVIVSDGLGIKWRNTFVYGEPHPQDRPKFWKLIKRIRPMSAEPWLMAGDFNEALFQLERISVRRRNERRMTDFRDTLYVCNLHDLGFTGTPWTYDNKQSGTKNVRVRLDRAIACPAWTTLFPHANVCHLISSRSDHCPILISLDKDDHQTHRYRPQRYEAMWERDPTLDTCVEEAWKHHRPAACLEDIQKKLAGTMESLCEWDRNKFGSVNKEIKALKDRLGRLQNGDYLRNQTEIGAIKVRLDEILLREEIMWRQRSRVVWLKEGEQNTSFFHRKVSGRAKKNKISKLRRADGTMTSK